MVWIYEPCKYKLPVERKCILNRAERNADFLCDFAKVHIGLVKIHDGFPVPDVFRRDERVYEHPPDEDFPAIERVPWVEQRREIDRNVRP